MKHCPGFLAIALLASCQESELPDSPEATPSRNVLMVTFDTTRRDYMGFHGRSPSPTPVLDQLAGESVVFDDAYTVTPLTLPSHASLMTGLYPASHGVRENSVFKLTTQAQTLAEVLSEQGYETAAVIAAFVLDESFGIAQGFDRYDNPRYQWEDSTSVVKRNGDEVIDVALKQLASLEPPFFFWLHLYDPHFPYEAIPPDAGVMDHRLQYEAEIEFADGQLGRFLQALRERKLYDDLLILFTADHGESLGDNLEARHGQFIYDSTMRVPFLIRHPRLTPGRVAEQVSLVDAMPTLLSLLDLSHVAPAAGFDGIDLTPMLLDRTVEWPTRGLAMESYNLYLAHGWAPFEGLVQGDLKYIHSRNPELYDRKSDPAETKNLFDAEDARCQSLTRAVNQIFGEPKIHLEASESSLDSQARQSLAELGYVSGSIVSSDRPEIATLPDAHERLPVIEKLSEFSEKLMMGQIDSALDVMRQLSLQEPNSAKIFELLGTHLLQYRPDLLDEAETALRRSLQLKPNFPAHHALGVVYLRRAMPVVNEAYRLAQQGQGDQASPLMKQVNELRKQALQEFERALALEPAHPETMLAVANVQQRRGEEALRNRNLDRARKLLSESLQAYRDFQQRIAKDHPEQERIDEVCRKIEASMPPTSQSP